MTALLAGHALVLPLVGLYQGQTVLHSVAHSVPLIGFAAAAWLLPLGRKHRAAVVAVGLLTSSALVVHLAHGSIEAHFHFFVVLGLIALYEEWLPFLLAFAYVVVHHGALGALDASAVYNHPDAQAHPWKWALIHGAFVAAAGAVNVASWQLNEDVRAERVRSSEIRATKNEQELERLLARERRQREFTNAVLDTAGIVIVVDREGRIVSFNRAAEELTGYSLAEVEGKHGDMFLPEEERAVVAARVGAAKPGAPSGGDNHWLTRDGEPRLLSWTNKAILDADGEVEYVVSSAIDITDHARAERQLAGQHERLREAESLSKTGAWSFDLRSRRTFWSDGMYGMLGLDATRQPADYAAFLALVHPDDRDRINEETTRRIFRTGVIESEYQIFRTDGRLLSVCARGRIERDRFGKATRLFGTVQDVSERKELEAERNQLQEQLLVAQRAEALGRFAGGIAHDFNNLLLAISGYSTLLGDDPGLDGQARGYADEIVKTTERAANLTRQLLAYSRKQVLAPTVLDLNSVVTDLARMLPRMIGASIELVTDLAHDLPPVRADRGQIEQVIMNLAVNARDAMPDGGTLTISTAQSELEQATGASVPAGRYVSLAVTDTGCGMDEETQRQLFDPFFTTKEVGKGTGLGLSTVDGIVRQSGGQIAVESEPGNGSTFTVFLPPDHGSVDDVTPCAGNAVTEGGRETILLVEDEEAVRRLVRTALTGKGYSILEATDGAAALALSHEHDGEIALAITDVVMPSMSGIDFSKRLTIARPSSKLIFMSGYPAGAADNGPRVPAGSNFIQKPFALADLIELVRSVLDSADHDPAVRTTYSESQAAAAS